MSGKGSRQRTYGSKFDENWDRIFGSKHNTPIGGSQKPSERNYRSGSTNTRGK